MVSRPERVSRAYRIADRRHLIFDGTGSYLIGGRWNSPGRRVIYAADSFAAAMLEVLVHANIGKLPRSHEWVEIVIPDDVPVEWVETSKVAGWDAEESESAQRLGDEWYDSQRSLVLLVPSVVTKGLSSNVVINQEHPDFKKLQASRPAPVLWDERLFASRTTLSFRASR